MAGKHVTFKFRDQAGLASSTDWIIPGVYGFSDTTLHLYACQDAATSKMPTQIWITADAHVYIPIAVDGNRCTPTKSAAPTASICRPPTVRTRRPIRRIPMILHPRPIPNTRLSQ